MRVGDKRFRILESCDLQELEFRGNNELGYVFHDQNKSEVILWKQAVDQLYISYRMALTDLEEVLRTKLEKIHDKLKKEQVKFNPILPFNVVVSPVHNPAKQVHQYDIKSGRFIQTFQSVKSALRAVAPEGTKSASNIHSVCIGKIKPNGYKSISAYGFRWSYDRKDRL